MNHTNEPTHYSHTYTLTNTERNGQTTPPGEKAIHSENGDEKNGLSLSFSSALYFIIYQIEYCVFVKSLFILGKILFFFFFIKSIIN